MKPALVIFDCDGVLIDSEALACRCEAEVLTAHGFPMTEPEVRRRFLGRSAASMLAEIEAQFGRPVPPAVMIDHRRRLEALFERELQPMPGIVETLDGLAGIPVCVASSSAPERLRHSLGLTGLWDRFAPHVFSATMVERGKPAPDLFLMAAARMGAAPADCIVIEDSAAGVEAGCAAGMRVVGFTGGSHCGDGHAGQLEAAGAHHVIDGFAALRQLIRTPV